LYLPFKDWLSKIYIFTGLATTTILQVVLAYSLRALPYSMKILLFVYNRSFLSIPGLRGKPPFKFDLNFNNLPKNIAKSQS